MFALLLCVFAQYLLKVKSVNITINNNNNIAAENAFDAALPVEAVCALYLAPSALPGHGRAIVAGKFIAEGQAVDRAVTLAIKYDDVKDTQLNNYVFGTNEDGITMTEFGVGMLYNHNKSPGIHHNWDTEKVAAASDQELAHTTFTTVTATATKNILGTISIVPLFHVKIMD